MREGTKSYKFLAFIFLALTIIRAVAFFLGVFEVIPGAGPFLPTRQAIQHHLMPYPWLAIAFRGITYILMILAFIFLALPKDREAKDRILKRFPPTIYLVFLGDAVALTGGFLASTATAFFGLVILTIFQFQITERTSMFEIDPTQQLLAWGLGLDTGWLITVTIAQFFALLSGAAVSLSDTALTWIALGLAVLMLVVSFFYTRRSRNAALPMGTALGFVMIFVQALLDGRRGFFIVVLGILAALSFLLVAVCYVGNGRKFTSRPVQMRY